MATRVAVISDVHGNLPALDAVESELRSADEVICAGDLIGYYPFQDEVIEMARDMGWLCVKGNHEAALLARDYSGFNDAAAEALRWAEEEISSENREWIRELPLERDVSLEGHGVHVAHGAPGDVHRYVTDAVPDVEAAGLIERGGGDALILGHTHRPMLRETRSGVLLNPGSVGQPRDGDPRASLATMEMGNGPEVEFLRKPYPVGETVSAVERAGLPAKLARRLSRGR